MAWLHGIWLTVLIRMKNSEFSPLLEGPCV